jgi:hypothetical protein
MNKLISLIILLIFLVPSVALPQTTYTKLQGVEYLVEGNSITVQWGPLDPIVQATELRLTMFDKDPVTYFALARVPAPTTRVVFNRPRTAHFRVEARSCRYTDCHVNDPNNPQNDLSVWVLSTDPTVGEVDGVLIGWWLYWKMPKPIVVIP